MPSTFSRKPWTKCWRACSPSVTISTPASSCSFTASMVASRLARASSSPLDRQGAHSVLGSASHSGFGKEPAIVVGNSMGASRSVLIERLSAMSYDRGTEQRKSPSPGGSLSFGSDHHQHLTGTGQLQRFRSPVVRWPEGDRDRG